MSQSDLDEIEQAIRDSRALTASIREALAAMDSSIDKALDVVAAYRRETQAHARD